MLLAYDSRIPLGHGRTVGTSGRSFVIDVLDIRSRLPLDVRRILLG